MGTTSLTASGPDSGFAIRWRHDQEFFNIEWARAYNRLGGRSAIDNPRVWHSWSLAGAYWEAKFVELGYPRLLHMGTDDAQALTVERKLFGVMTKVVMQDGSPVDAHQVMSVGAEAFASDNSFTLKVTGLHKFHLTYQAADMALRLVWSETPTIDMPTEFGDTGHLLKEHYMNLGTMELVRLPVPVNAALRDIRINFAGLALDRYPGLIFGVPWKDPRSLIPSVTPSFEGFPLRLSFNEEVFSSLQFGLAPADKDWAIGLFLPAGARQGANRAEREADGFSMVSYHEPYLPSTPPATDAVLQPDPCMSIWPAGNQKVLLSLIPASSSANWGFEGDHLGSLDVSQGVYHYVPPTRPTPEPQVNSNSDFPVAPARRSSLRSPVNVDVVKVTDGDLSALSVFVTEFAGRTHMVKAVKSGAGLQLSLWYYSVMGEEERQVPAGDVRWTKVAGDGSLSAQGLFTPSTQASAKGIVVMGEDTRQEFDWAWGMTILPCPFLDIDSITNLLQGPPS